MNNTASFKGEIVRNVYKVNVLFIDRSFKNISWWMHSGCTFAQYYHKKRMVSNLHSVRKDSLPRGDCFYTRLDQRARHIVTSYSKRKFKTIYNVLKMKQLLDELRAGIWMEISKNSSLSLCWKDWQKASVISWGEIVKIPVKNIERNQDLLLKFSIGFS